MPSTSRRRGRSSLGLFTALACSPMLAVPLVAHAGDDAASAVPAPLARQLRQDVALPGGLKIHSTSAQVANFQTIAIPGTNGVIAVWEEIDRNGQRTPMQAASLDGQSLSGRVRENSTEVALRYARFDPRAGGEPAVDAALKAGAQNEVYLVQFVATPLPIFREQIEAAGGKIVRVVPDNTFVVQLAGGARDRVAALPYVRWVGAYHSAYKLDPGILGAIRAGTLGDAETFRYSIECFDRGAEAQERVAAKIRAIGGIVELTTPDQFRMEATLTPQQMLQVAQLNDVNIVEPWAGPAENDMNIVRAIGGANFIETNLSLTGQGVRGQVTDSELRNTHQEYSTFGATLTRQTANWGNAANPHGSSAFSIVFARGADAGARGMLPNAAQRIFLNQSDTTHGGGALSRLAVNQQLVNPAGTYRAVFTSNSWGNTRTQLYTTVSAETDDSVFQTNLVFLQSQSNAGSFGEPLQNSRPQAWAKNVVSVGGVNHEDTLSRADDNHGGGASTGPAQDGRIKPDVCGFYDFVRSATNTSDTSYGNFGGTSAATPMVAGHFGLFFQMWHEGVWPGFGGKSDVFDSRANAMTAKAAIANSSFQYNWPAGGTNGDITRFVQGWGMPDLQNLYNLRNNTFIVDGGKPISPDGRHTYKLLVNGNNPLKITMAYMDPQGNPAAAIDRINDLSLRVTAPNGTVYWGNNGLTAGLFSTSGGASNTRDTIENVFVQTPAEGVWTVEILGDTIVQDANLSTAVIDATYSIWATGGVDAGLGSGPFAWAVNSNGTDNLHVIDLSTGEAQRQATVLANNDLEGLAFGPEGSIYGLSGSSPQALVDVSLAPGSTIGSSPLAGIDSGLSYYDGQLYGLSAAVGSTSLYRINPNTGVGTLLGAGTAYADGLAIDGEGNAFASGFVTGGINIYRVNLTTGALTLLGSTGVGYTAQTGLAFGADNTLYMITSDSTATGTPSQIFSINTATGAAQFIGNVTLNGANIDGFEDLAIDRFNATNRMDIPANTGNFVSTLTRGFYFTAPYNGTIAGLRVPTDVGSGAQNIEVIRLNAAPPVFPTTTTGFESLGRFIGVAGDNVISCEIPVKQGDIIGVLGGRTASATTISNGYTGNTSTFNTSIRGQAVSIAPLGTQVALNVSNTNEVFTGGGINIARVQVYYRDGRSNLYLDGATPTKGSNLGTLQLLSPLGVTSAACSIGVNADDEMIALGARGADFRGLGVPPEGEIRFNFNVNTIEFLYGGNLGNFNAQAINENGVVVDSFTQADTGNGQPAGPLILSGTNIRRLTWADSGASSTYVSLDNIRINGVTPCYANCDSSTVAPVLNALDFQCFLQRFNQGLALPAANQVVAYGNCDGSTVPPVLNALDFSCYLVKYREGLLIDELLQAKHYATATGPRRSR